MLYDTIPEIRQLRTNAVTSMRASCVRNVQMMNRVSQSAYPKKLSNEHFEMNELENNQGKSLRTHNLVQIRAPRSASEQNIFF